MSGSLTDESVTTLALCYTLVKNPIWPMPNLEETLKLIRVGKLLSGIISNAQCVTPLLFDAFLKSNLDNLGFRRELIPSYDINGTNYLLIAWN